MIRTSQVLLVLAAVLAVGTLAVVCVDGRIVQVPGPSSAATPPPAPDDSAQLLHGTVREAAPAAAPPRGSEERNRGLARALEGALLSRAAHRREIAFAMLLPDLIAADAGKVIAILARQQPGETRDLLRDEIARQWVRQDRDSAIAWMKSLDDPADRAAAATTAMRSIAASDPGQAVIVADELGVGRDDGSIEHILQVWVASDRAAALRWLATQPPD